MSHRMMDWSGFCVVITPIGVGIIIPRRNMCITWNRCAWCAAINVRKSELADCSQLHSIARWKRAPLEGRIYCTKRCGMNFVFIDRVSFFASSFLLLLFFMVHRGVDWFIHLLPATQWKYKGVRTLRVGKENMTSWHDPVCVMNGVSVGVLARLHRHRRHFCCGIIVIIAHRRWQLSHHDEDFEFAEEGGRLP